MGLAWLRWAPTRSSRAWLTRLDLPEPEMPVTAVKQPKGKAALRLSRLLRVMPSRRSQSLGTRELRAAMCSSPKR
ncbi:hypothetical protein D9M68_878850 [compost metagenome]